MGLYKASSNEFQLLFISDRFNPQEVTVFAAKQPFTFFLLISEENVSLRASGLLPQYDDEEKR